MATRLRRLPGLRPDPSRRLWTGTQSGDERREPSEGLRSVAPMTAPASWPVVLDRALRALPGDGLLADRTCRGVLRLRRRPGGPPATAGWQGACVTASWTLAVARADLLATSLTEHPAPEPADGQALLRVDRVGVTANNVTYGVLGEAFRYWEFFPAADPAQGLVPLWGFAEVAQSRAEGVQEGERVYGYLPPSGHLLVTPARPDGRGFRDAAPHRAELPSPYNAYALTTGDPAYEADREDLQVLFRPLFFTSFMLADALQDAGLHGASAVVLSSASSKTAYGTAFLLREQGVRTVGLTSAGNVAFTQGLGCYDRVLAYDDVAELATEPTVYADLAGSASLRTALHAHLQTALVHDAVVGVTHQDSGPAGTLQGARPQVFFAPEQMRKRTQDWGRDGLDAAFGDAWRRFAPVVEGWVDVEVSEGPHGLERVWREVASGTSAPRTGHVVQL